MKLLKPQVADEKFLESKLLSFSESNIKWQKWIFVEDIKTWNGMLVKEMGKDQESEKMIVRVIEWKKYWEQDWGQEKEDEKSERGKRRERETVKKD